MSVDLAILAERRRADDRGWELAVPWYEGPVSYFGVPDESRIETDFDAVEFDEAHRSALRSLLGSLEPELRDLIPLPHHLGLPADASEPLRRIHAQKNFAYGWAWALLAEWMAVDWERSTVLHHFDAPSEAITYRQLAGERFFTETLATLQSFGAPDAVRVVWYFY